MSFRDGKLTVITQLATHWPAAASDNAAARIRLGNISPSSTQTTGPQDIPNETTKRFAARSAIGPLRTLQVRDAVGPIGAVPKITAMRGRA